MVRRWLPFAHETPAALLSRGVLCVRASPQVGAALQQRCHGLRKLGAVLRLLEVRLADIVEAWEAGALGAAGLGLGEVGRLVCALFEDTDYRAQCLQRMEAAEGL